MTVLQRCVEIRDDHLSCHHCGNVVNFKNGGLHHTGETSQLILCAKCALPVAVSILLDAMELVDGWPKKNDDLNRRLRQLVNIGEKANWWLSILQQTDSK